MRFCLSEIRLVDDYDYRSTAFQRTAIELSSQLQQAKRPRERSLTKFLDAKFSSSFVVTRNLLTLALASGVCASQTGCIAVITAAAQPPGDQGGGGLRCVHCSSQFFRIACTASSKCKKATLSEELLGGDLDDRGASSRGSELSAKRSLN